MASNGLIAQKLRKIADLLEVQDANPFRVRAYRNAARTIETLDRSLEQMVAAGEDLQELSGIGEDISELIVEFIEDGTMETLEEAREEVPDSVAELTDVDGLGPKRASQLYRELDVTTLDELEEAAAAGEIAELDGFGEKTQQKILEGIEPARRHGERHRRDEAQRAVEPLLSWLHQAEGVERVEVAGSYRRGRETVGDIDVLFESPDPDSVMEQITEFREVENVAASGEAKTTVTLYSGLQVDARSIAKESFGSALVYFTGSKQHNIALRNRALDRDMSLSEYGLFEGKEGEGERVASETEEDIYKALDLVWIPPEIREDTGEIEAAVDNDLPRLVEAEEIAADIHMHTTWSDGNHSIEDMIEACRDRGYHTVAITDHSPSLAMTGGLDPDKLQRQLGELAELRERYDDIAILSGMEVDILEDGSLDMTDDMLEKLDVVIVSVHGMLELGRKEQTERVLKALEHPLVSFLAHPTSRKINERDPIEIDLSAVIEKAAEVGIALEINAAPERLDLSPEHARQAKEQGVKIVVNTDAHSIRELGNMRFGVKSARRAWLEADDVINTWAATELRAFLDRSNH
jgi:DNA polymerase (family 10)